MLGLGIVANAIGASLAAVALMRAVDYGDPRLRPLWGAVLGLTLLTLTFYLYVMVGGRRPFWLGVHTVDVIVWLVVFGAPPAVTTHLYRRDLARLVELERRRGD